MKKSVLMAVLAAALALTCTAYADVVDDGSLLVSDFAEYSGFSRASAWKNVSDDTLLMQTDTSSEIVYHLSGVTSVEVTVYSRYGVTQDGALWYSPSDGGVYSLSGGCRRRYFSSQDNTFVLVDAPQPADLRPYGVAVSWSADGASFTDCGAVPAGASGASGGIADTFTAPVPSGARYVCLSFLTASAYPVLERSGAEQSLGKYGYLAVGEVTLYGARQETEETAAAPASAGQDEPLPQEEPEGEELPSEEPGEAEIPADEELDGEGEPAAESNPIEPAPEDPSSASQSTSSRSSSSKSASSGSASSKKASSGASSSAPRKAESAADGGSQSASGEPVPASAASYASAEPSQGSEAKTGRALTGDAVSIGLIAAIGLVAAVRILVGKKDGGKNKK